MKLLVTVALAAGIGYVVAKKTGILDGPEVERLTSKTRDMAQQAGESVMDARQSAMASTADRVEDLAGHAADTIRRH